MALWHCAACTAAYAVGSPCCPQCGSTEREGEVQMPKINRAGVSYEPGREPGALAGQDGAAAAAAPGSPAPDPGQDPAPPGSAEPPAAGPEDAGTEPEAKPAPARVPRKASDG